jgi:hypothetical protein
VRTFAGSIARRLLGADSWVVGYPKCGNTWFGLMVRKALALSYGIGNDALAGLISDWKVTRLVTGVPAIGATHHMPRFNVEGAGDLCLDFRVFRGRRVVLLIRDPRDVLVSLYMHNVHRAVPPAYHGSIDAMVRDDVYGIDKFLKYYSSWYAHRSVPGALMLLRYEDLSRAREQTLTAALRFLGLPGVDADLVRRVADYGSFANMRKLEETNALGLPTLAPAVRPGAEAFKVRKGQVGGYRQYLSEETVRYVDGRVEAALPPFYGYSSAVRPEPAS